MEPERSPVDGAWRTVGVTQLVYVSEQVTVEEPWMTVGRMVNRLALENGQLVATRKLKGLELK